MKLILRNQIVRSAQTEFSTRKTTSKTIVALALASIVTGVNYYFQNFIAETDN
jgi:hypothetical protein